MTKYTFSVDGASVVIYPVSSLAEAERDLPLLIGEGEISVALLPDLSCDFRIVCLNKEYNTPRELHIPLAALSCFLKRVRGYPDMMLDIACESMIFKLYLDKTEKYNFTLKDEKCKILCTKMVRFADETCVTVDVVDRCGGCAVLICGDAELFDSARADLMLSRLRQDGIHSLVIASYSDCIVIGALGDITAYEAIAMGLSAISSRGTPLAVGRYTALVNRRPIDFLRLSSAIVFYPEINCIS